jgi:hypothetical protein
MPKQIQPELSGEVSMFHNRINAILTSQPNAFPGPQQSEIPQKIKF